MPEKTNPLIWANDVLVNLKNVSNINILDSLRVVFNMNYTISMINTYDKKLISDYVYWDAEDEHELEDNLEFLKSNQFMKENFIYLDNHFVYINKNEISSVKFLDHRNRIIFNLSHPVSFKGRNGQMNLTSEFVYINCNSSEEFEKQSQKIKISLNVW